MASERRRAGPRALLLAVLTTCAVTTVAPLAEAQSLSDRETARSMMEDGDAKREKGDWKGALKSYEAADAIMHVPTTGFEVGRAQASVGLLLEARETLNRVERIPTKPNEPAPFAQARTAAAELSADIATRIPTIVVAVKNAEGARDVFVDGDKIPAAAAEAPRKVNPGAHTVMVRAGGIEKQEKITVAEREQKVVTIDLKPAPVADKPLEASTSSSGSSLPKILMIGGFSVGAIGLGVGTVTGIMTFGKVDDIKATCNPKCLPSQQSEIDDTKALGNIANVAFVVGGLGVAAGVVGVVLASKEKSAGSTQNARAARVVPVVSPTWAGLEGTF